MAGDDEVAFVVVSGPVWVSAEDRARVAVGLADERVVALVACGKYPDPGVDFDAVSFAKFYGGGERIPSFSEGVLLWSDSGGIDGIACVDGF